MKKTQYFSKILSLLMAILMLSSVIILPASAATAPKAPATITATPTTSSIKLTWSKVSGATGYRIYYKFPRDLHWKTAVSSTTATSKTWKNLPPDEIYIFAVRSYTKSNGKTSWSGYKQITTATKTTAPKTLTATQSTSAIKLTWSKVDCAEGYRIFYKTASSDPWKVIVKSTDKTTYTFKDLPSGKKYFYAVQSLSNTHLGTFYGNYKTIETATKPATPKVSATSTESSITLKWNKISGADGYRVYYKTGSSAWKTAVSSTTATKYTLKNTKSNTSYIFAVKSYIKIGSDSIWSGYKEMKHQYGVYNGELKNIISAMYQKRPMEFMVGDPMPVDLNDPWSVKSYLGLGDPDKTASEGNTSGSLFKEAYFSESMIGAQAYSLAVARVSDIKSVEQIKTDMFNGIDTGKWIFVQADQLRVVSYKDVIMLVMVSSQLDNKAADELVKAFAETVSESSVTKVESVLTGAILKKG